MSATSVLSATDFSSRLEQYLFERSEEWRAVRVGEKEVSEQAEIVRRYSDLFSREQLDALRQTEDGASGDERELLYRLRKTCESGLVSARGRARESPPGRACHVSGGRDAASQRAGAARRAR